MGEINIFDLKPFLTKYNSSIFVETGTGTGYGLGHAAKFDFKSLYSIEIIESLYKDNVEKFKDDKRITLFNTDSLSGLTAIMNLINETDRIMFWLDAHFPGADFHLDGYSYHDDLNKKIKLPLEEELDLILNARPNNKDIFIIDDLNLYEDGSYELGNIREDLKYLREKYNLKGIEFIKKGFESTHIIKKVSRHQGFLFILPKETQC